MTKIVLSKGKEALVDDEDYLFINSFRWFFNGHYAARMAYGNTAPIYMHRLIMRATAGVHIDHIDGDKLNNQKGNLRIATKSQNSMNSKKRAGCSSKFKGVSWDKTRNKWLAELNINQKKIHLGRFDNEADAAKAYDTAANRIFGEFAKTNYQGQGVQ